MLVPRCVVSGASLMSRLQSVIGGWPVNRNQGEAWAPPGCSGATALKLEGRKIGAFDKSYDCEASWTIVTHCQRNATC